MSVVVITGCSTGIGLETALAFARRGETVVATMRDLSRAAYLLERASAEGLAVELEQLDVNDDDSVVDGITAIESRHGAIDVLVNNAGIGHEGPVELLDIAKARAVFETNVWGPVRTIRAALVGMRARRSGVIVNVGSVAGRVSPLPFHGFYGASKHAIGVLSEALAQEVAPFGIRVVNVEPGFFRTEIVANGLVGTADSGPYAPDQEWVNEYFHLGMNELGGDPSDVAQVIVEAATTESLLHVPVGVDALMLIDTFKTFESFEEAAAFGAEFIGSTVGRPRPSSVLV